jgi:predicted XRE-type DNA-binding protein
MKNDAKRKELEAHGYQVFDNAWEAFGLAPEERALQEMYAAASVGVKRLREAQGLTQAEVAERIGSSQSRVAKIETTTKGVTLHLALRAFFALGGKLEHLDVKNPTPIAKARKKKVVATAAK